MQAVDSFNWSAVSAVVSVITLVGTVGVGGIMTGCTTSNGAATNSLITCSLTTAFPGPSTAPAIIIWDTSELCTGGSQGGLASSCPSFTYTLTGSPATSFTKCYAVWDTAGASPVTISSHHVSVAITPQLCE